MAANGGAFAAINNGDGTDTRPPTFTSIGKIRQAVPGYDQSRVRFGDLDGDGRADYCVLESNGDIRCWRDGGWGEFKRSLSVLFGAELKLTRRRFSFT